MVTTITGFEQFPFQQKSPEQSRKSFQSSYSIDLSLKGYIICSCQNSNNLISMRKKVQRLIGQDRNVRGRNNFLRTGLFY